MPPGIRRRVVGSQRYTIAMPAGLTGETAVPLILALHYGGTVTPFYGAGLLTTLVEPALRALRAIIAAPDCGHKGWDNAASETAVLQLLQHLQQTCPIDPARIALTGYSMGGKGTWHIAARHQDIFSAAIPMAALPPADVVNIAWRIPLFVLHGSEDDHFPVHLTEQVVRQLQANGAAVAFQLLPGITHYQTDQFVQPLQTAVSWLQSIWLT